MVTMITAPAPLNGDNSNPQGHCGRCGKIWVLNEGQGVCRWCGKLSHCQTSTTKPRHVKSSSRRRLKQDDHNGNGYGQLQDEWLTYYKVASHFAHKAKTDDTQDLLHDIILTLARAERNNGHKPFTEAVMYRIASRAQADYWYRHYKLTMGLDCGHCSSKQRRKCKEEWLYGECPKLVKIESLNKPVIDSEGNITELGELIADDKTIDLDAWVSNSTWEIGYPKRLVEIAYKLKAGEALNHYERTILSRYRQKEQKKLFN